MGRKELLERFDRFCKNLSPSDRIAIVHHSDADGFCAAIIAAKAIERITGQRVKVVQPYEYGNKKQGREAVKRIEKAKANTLVVLDLGIDSAPHSLRDKVGFEQCLVIDHHRMYRDLNSEKTVFLKAEAFTKKDPSSYVTAKFAFDLFSRITDVSDLDWLACLGIIGDMNLGAWKGFVQKTIEKSKVSLTWLYRFNDLIAAVEVLAGDEMPALFWEFYNAKNPGDVLESGFKKHLEKFKEEKDSQVEGFREKAEKFPELELFFYSIRTRHENIKSYIINELTEMHPNKTIVLLQYLGRDRVRFSARRQDFKVKMNELLVEAVKGIPDTTAGGHIPAAAGSIPKKHVSKFKENVLRILKKKYGKK